MSVVGQQLINAVKAVAEANPDYVYERPTPSPAGGSCRYVFDGQPSCIVGKAAWDLGLIDAHFEARIENFGGVDELLHVLDVEVDLGEEKWLLKAQDLQDVGMPWGLVPGRASL